MRATLLILALIASSLVSAQEVISVTGGEAQNVSWTIGEIVTETIVAADGSQITQGFNQPLEFILSGIIEVADNELIFNAYPNPAVDQLQISFKSHDQYTWQIVDILGRIIQSGTAKEETVTIDFANFISGKYVLNIAGPDKKQSVIIIKN